jgi:Carboxymuconolactone decarboxylase family
MMTVKTAPTRQRDPQESSTKTERRSPMSSIYPLSTAEIHHRRRELAPNQQAAFDAFSHATFADGALPAKLKQIIAVAVAHVTQFLIASMAIRRRRCAREHHQKN